MVKAVGNGYSVGDRVYINPEHGASTPSAFAFLDLAATEITDGQSEIYRDGDGG